MVFLISNTSFADDNDTTYTYRWGRGLNIPAFNLNLGGYSGISFEHTESDPEAVILDDISFFVSWSPHARIRFFSEFEMENFISSNDGVANFWESFNLERLYVDFLVSDSFSIRLGQFMTPVGIWNKNPIMPLVWTSSRPLVTKSYFFPSRTNGLMLTQQWIINNHNLDISIYLDDSNHLDPRQVNHHQSTYSEVAFKQAIGTSIRYKVNHELDIGLSSLVFKKRMELQQTMNYLIGLDLFWKKNGYELQTEWAYRYAPERLGNEVSGYIQGVIPLGNEIFAVERYELLSGQHQDFYTNFNGVTHIGVSALVWRPFFFLVLKAEYRFGHNNKQLVPSGFFSSISVLF